MNYNCYLKSNHWQRVKAALHRRYIECGICKSKKNLNIHHVDYSKRGHEEIEDLVVLCQSCHFKAHKDPLFIEGALWLSLHHPERNKRYFDKVVK